MPGTPRNTPTVTLHHGFPWFLLIVANVMWAASYVASKIALRETSVSFMLAGRMFIAALILLPLLLARWRELRLTRRDLVQLALLALIGFVVNKLFEYNGLALTTASDVALLISSESIFTAALSWILLRERFRKLTLLALLLGLLGVYLIIERQLVPELPSGGGAIRILGDLLVVLSLLLEALYTVRGKALLVKHSPLLVTAASISGSALFWGPVAVWNVASPGWHMPGLITWLSIGWLALMSTVLPYLAWFYGLAKVDGSAAASTLFLQPLLGTLLAVVVLQEQLTPITLLGGLLIIVSVYIISRST